MAGRHIQSDNQAYPKPVAIVGIATEFPSGRHSQNNLDHNEFFQFLLQKLDAYERIPSERFDINTWKGHGLGKIATDKGAFLKNIDLFDYLEFGITAKDAKSMALSTRKLIELSFLALLDSGVDYRGREVGCFTSGVAFDILSISNPDELDAKGSFAGNPSMIANRISYHLDLLGPSIPIDTACSSSLTALHLAVQSLRAGECESAVVGACQLNHRLVDWVQYSQGSVLSSDGMCKPFDASADGFSRAEGAAVIVVKLLEHALRDDDRIYGSILGTGVNANGSAAPANAPVAAGQLDAMRRAYKGISRQPTDVDFIELHATGTAAGDPIEANWVGENFYKNAELRVGSVKGNVGHMEVTAFLASLSKVCSIFKHGIIPPNVNLTTLNPAIDWDKYRLRVPTEALPIQSEAERSRPLVSICSSGIGGSNGHAVVEAPPSIFLRSQLGNQLSTPVLLLAGGLTPRSAAVVANDLDALASQSSDILAVASIYGRRIRQMTWRSYSIRLPDGSASIAFCPPVHSPRIRAPIVFAIAGQGPQHIHMGRQLFQIYSVFRESIVEMDKTYELVTGKSLMKMTGIFDNTTPPTPLLPDITILPALAMVQIALIDLLRSIGIKPDVIVGHSAGETVAMYASGASSRSMAVEIAIARSVAMSSATECGGAMAALMCSTEQAREIIQEVAGSDSIGKVEIACYNARDAVALSGLTAYIEKAVQEAQRRGFFARKLHTSAPAHSSLMDNCHSEYADLVGAVFARHSGEHSPQVPIFSTLTGSQWNGPYTPAYFWRNVREAVLFQQSISSILATFPTAVFLEISPHPTLSSYISNMCTSSNNVICPMLRCKNYSSHDEARDLLDAVGRLVTMGYNSADITILTERAFSALDMPLPSYPFSPKHVPYLPDSPMVIPSRRIVSPTGGPLNRSGLRISSLTHSDLAQHVIRGEPIMPASGYLEMVFQLGARELRYVKFSSMMPLPSDKALQVDVNADGATWSVTSNPLDNCDSREPQTRRFHAGGYFSRDIPRETYKNLDIEDIKNRCALFKEEGFYQTLSYFAQYGPKFQRISSCFKGNSEALVEVRGAESDLVDFKEYKIHPAILDACIHVMVHPAFTGQPDRNIYYLPSRVNAVVLHTLPPIFPQSLYSHATFREWNPDYLLIDYTITDLSGSRICTLTGFEVARHMVSVAPLAPSSRYDIVFEPTNVRFEQSELVPPYGTGSVNRPLPSIQPFKMGQEMHILRCLREALSDGTVNLWIEAHSPMDSAAARGFTRSLRKEMFNMAIRLVTFDSKWSTEDRKTVIHRLSVDMMEDEVHVDSNGNVHTLRLSPLLGPKADVFHPDSYWVYIEKGIAHPPLPSVSAQHIMVRVSSCSIVEGDLWSFTGQVVDACKTVATWPLGSTVLGLAQGPLSNIVLSHEGRVYSLNDPDSIAPHSSFILAMIIIGYSIGHGTLDHPERLSDDSILLADADTKIGQALVAILESLCIPFTPLAGGRHLENIDLFTSSTIIISGAQTVDDIRFIRSASKSSTRIFFWNDPWSGVYRAIDGNKWSVSDALQKIMPKLPSVPSKWTIESVEPSGRIPEGLRIVPSNLFHPQNTYILLGGIGSFGIHCALWMYEQGARSIVLTSRSGKLSLARSKNMLGMRMVDYLERLPGLTIRLEKCDSTSSANMTALLASIPGRIAGIFLMSVILSDKPFLEHTPESYATAFAPKVGSLQILQTIYPIHELDFLVSISSASTFGNAGQTNYASANCVVDEMLRSYPNAFSLVAPAILDSSTISQTEDLLTDPHLAHWTSWAMSSRQVCDCIGDGIRMLKTQSFGLYIPEYDWYRMQRDFGGSPIYDHIVGTAPTSPFTVDDDLALQTLVMRHLDVDIEEFDPKIAFTAYGLDSLDAGRLSLALKPYISLTQIQLLADVNFDDLKRRIGDSRKAREVR